MAGRPRKKTDDNSFISKQLRKLIGAKSFSEFERINHLPVRTLQRIMDGNDPRISTLSMIAKACNVTLDYFFDGDTSKKTSPTMLTGDDNATRLLSTLTEAQIHLAQIVERVATKDFVPDGFDAVATAIRDITQRAHDMLEISGSRKKTGSDS